MILVLLYLGAGAYMLLMFLGLIHREYMKTMNTNRRIGLFILAVGFLILGVTYAFYYFGPKKDPAGMPVRDEPRPAIQENFPSGTP